MTIDEVIASSTALANTAGQDLVKTVFGIFPTWLIYAIPIGLVVGVVGYFLHRRRLGRG